MDQEVKNISSDAEKKLEQVAKYTAKDSVFTSLFREPKYLLQLYQALHPEDHEATEDSIKNVTRTKRGSEKMKIGTAQKLYKKGSSIEDIADIFDASVKEVEQWLGLVRA